MRRDVVKTGKFGIGVQIHTVHVGTDAKDLTDFYRDVFGVYTYMGAGEPNYEPREDRRATLNMISDLCLEVVAPNQPINPMTPLSKFFTKFGPRFHSIGYNADDLVGLGDHLIGCGVRIAKPGGGLLEKIPDDLDYVFPNLKDTCGVMIEFCSVDMPDDPRLRDDWSERVAYWRDEHPLGIERLAYQTAGVRDLDASVARFEQLFGATPIASGESAAEGARYTVLHLGDGLFRLAQPTTDGTSLAAHVERYGDLFYGVTFRVRDLDAAASWLAQKNVRTTRLSDSLLAADPSDIVNAPYFFTVEDIPGDPFA